MASKHNEENERIKRRYLEYLKFARRLSEPSIDAAAAAVERFECWNKRKPFKKFRIGQAMAFRDYLDRETNPKTGKPLSKATLRGIMHSLRAFFIWLADQEGYRSRIRYSDAEYFNISNRDRRLANDHEERPVPSTEQARRALNLMPAGTLIEQRNRAAFALLLLTGIRVSALISLRNKHLDVSGQNVFQDAREVRTKFSKTSRVYFVQDYPEARDIVADWECTQREVMLRGPDDPLFPATEVSHVAGKGFQATGLTRTPWSSTAALGKIIKAAFENAGCDQYSPHSFRHMHARRKLESFRNLEEFKAHSENLGHKDISTTLNSYAKLTEERRRELILGRN